jgi:hypothetical protein
MSSLAWFIVLFFVPCLLVVAVYVIVVKAFYWGGKDR